MTTGGQNKKTESKKTETKKPTPTIGTRKPFWDGRSRVSTSNYRENYDFIFKRKTSK